MNRDLEKEILKKGLVVRGNTMYRSVRRSDKLYIQSRGVAEHTSWIDVKSYPVENYKDNQEV